MPFSTGVSMPMPCVRRAPLTFCLALLVSLTVACAGNRPSPPHTDAPVEAAEYVIGAGDLLRVVVWRNPEISGEVPVRNDGVISVTLLDDVKAEGLTPEQLKGVIAERLNEFISAPDVTVTVMQPLSKRVYVLGEVGRSGMVPLLKDLRITDAVAASGGFGPFANKGSIRVIRREGMDEVEYYFDYDDYIAGRAPGSNILLQAGDTVIVPD